MASTPVRILAAATCAGLVAAGVAGSAPSPPQTLFAGILAADSHTDAGVRLMLHTGAAFVDPSPEFAELTGDGKSDAVVTVENGGAAGAVGVYVLSADGARNGRLRVVMRAQHLYQARVRVSGATVTVITPVFAPGDDLCCAGRVIERDYAWSARSHRFTKRATRRLPATP
jgi:hypothetical protein